MVFSILLLRPLVAIILLFTVASVSQTITLKQPLPSVLHTSYEEASVSIVVSIENTESLPLSPTYTISWGDKTQPESTFEFRTVDNAELETGILLENLDSSVEYTIQVRDANGVIQPSQHGESYQPVGLIPRPQQIFVDKQTSSSFHTTTRVFFKVQQEYELQMGKVNGIKLNSYSHLPESSSPVSPQYRCHGDALVKGTFGSCCASDHHCQSGVCDLGRKVCTMKCISNQDCRAPSDREHTPGFIWAMSSCVVAQPERGILYDSDDHGFHHAGQLVCDATRYSATNSNSQFCTDTCNGIFEASQSSGTICPFDPSHPMSPCRDTAACSKLSQLKSNPTQTRLLGGVSSDSYPDSSIAHVSPPKYSQEDTRAFLETNEYNSIGINLRNSVRNSLRQLHEQQDHSICPIRHDIPECGTNSTMFDAKSCTEYLLSYCETSDASGCQLHAMSVLQSLHVSQALAVHNWLPQTNISIHFQESNSGKLDCSVDSPSSDIWLHPEECADQLLEWCSTDSVYSLDPRCQSYISWHGEQCGNSMLVYCLNVNPLDPFCLSGVEATQVGFSNTIRSHLPQLGSIIINEIPQYHDSGLYSVQIPKEFESIVDQGAFFSLQLSSGIVFGLPATSLETQKPHGFLAEQQRIIQNAQIQVAIVGTHRNSALITLSIPEEAIQSLVPYTRAEKFRLEWAPTDAKQGPVLPHPEAQWIEVNTSSNLGQSTDEGIRVFELQVFELTPPASVFEFRVLLHGLHGGYWKPIQSSPILTKFPETQLVRSPSLAVEGVASATMVIMKALRHSSNQAGDGIMHVEWFEESTMNTLLSSIDVTVSGSLGNENPTIVDAFGLQPNKLQFARASAVDQFGVQSKHSTIIAITSQEKPLMPKKADIDFLSTTNPMELVASLTITEVEFSSRNDQTKWPTYYSVSFGFLTANQTDLDAPLTWKTQYVARTSSSPLVEIEDRTLESQHRLIGILGGVVDDFPVLCTGSAHGSHLGAFADCCDSDSQCQSGLCNTETRTCTQRCLADSDCPLEPISGSRQCVFHSGESSSHGIQQMGLCKAEKAMSLFSNSYCQYCEKQLVDVQCVFDQWHPMSPCVATSPCANNAIVSQASDLGIDCQLHITKYCASVNVLDSGCQSDGIKAIVNNIEASYCPFDRNAAGSPCGELGSCSGNGLFHPTKMCQYEILFYCKFDSNGVAHNTNDIACSSSLLVELAGQVDTCPFANDHSWSPCAMEPGSPCLVPYLDSNGTQHVQFVQYAHLHESILENRVWNSSYTNPRVDVLCRRRIESYCALVNTTDPACHSPEIRSWVGDFNTTVHDFEQDECGREPALAAISLGHELNVDEARSYEFHTNLVIPNEFRDQRFRLRVSGCNVAGCGDYVEAQHSGVLPFRASLDSVYLSTNKICAQEPGPNTIAAEYTISVSPLSTSLPVTVEIVTDDTILKTEPQVVQLSASSFEQNVKVFVSNQVFDAVGAGYYTSIVQHQVVGQGSVNIQGNSEVVVNVFKSGWSGVAAYPMNIEVSEDGVSPAVEIVLLSKPSGGSVEVFLSSDDLQIIIEPRFLVFDELNWNTPQTVIVSAVDDKYAEPISQFQEIKVEVLASNSPELDGKHTLINVRNYDNDVPYLVQETTSPVDQTVTTSRFCEGIPQALQFGESQEATVYFRLNTQPRAPVVVNFAGIPGVIEVLTPTVVIEPSSWNVLVPVTVLATDNNVDIGTDPLPTRIECTVTSTDKDYNAVGTELFEILNEDRSDVQVSKFVVNVAEANNLGEGSLQDTVSFKLETEPSFPVTYAFVDFGGQVWVNPPSITFTAQNWNTTQVVTISAVPDGDEGEDVLHETTVDITVTTEDQFYAPIAIPSLQVKITDASAIADLTPAPELLSAKLEDTAHNITLVLDRGSNMAGYTPRTLAPCESFPEQVSYFAESTMAILGDSPQCYFDSPNVLVIVLGQGYTVGEGDTINIQGGAIRVNDKSIIYTVGTAKVVGRLQPPTLVDGIFSDNGASLSLYFTGQNSQQVNGKSVAPCTEVLEEAYLLGIGSECSFVDSNTLVVSLGVGSEIVPDLGSAPANSTTDAPTDATTDAPTDATTDAPTDATTDAPTTLSPTNTTTEPPTESSTSAPTNATEGSSTRRRRLLEESIGCKNGQSLQLKRGAVTAVVGGLLSTTGCVNIRPPLNPPQVSPVLSGVVSLGLCDDLVMDGFQSVGGAGRKMALEWSILTNTSLQSNITTALEENKQRYSRKITISRDLIEAGKKLVVQLSARNFLNPTPGIATAVISKTSLPIPSIRILGTKVVRTTRSRGATLFIAQGKSPSCGSADSGRRILYDWKTLEGDIDVLDPALQSHFFNRDSRKLKIPAEFLKVGGRYSFEVVGRMAADPAVSNSATVQLVVESDVIIAQIAGRSTVGAADTFELNALSSKDKDNLVDIPFRFFWTCTDLTTNAPCSAIGEDSTPIDLSAYYQAGPTSEFGTGAVLRVLGGTLPPKRSYRFGLQLTKEDVFNGGFRASNSTFDVQVKSGSPPGAIIVPIVDKVNPNKKVILQGEASSKLPSTLEVVWSNTDKKIDDSIPSLVYSLGPIGPQLVIKPNVLQPGSSYTFQMKAKDVWGEAAAKITIVANAAPTSGYLLAHRKDDEESNRGIMLNTTFTLSALDWTDDASDMPLRYAYSFIIGDDDGVQNEQPISELSQDSVVEYFFPRGDPEQEGKITLVLYVQDRLGAEFRTTRNSTGLPSFVYVDMEKMSAAETAAFISNAADSLLSGAVEDADPVTLYAALNVLSDLMEDLSDPCEEVDCGLFGTCTEGLCECNSGYEGDFCEIAPPEPINAGFSDWSEWSPCSFACGGGIQSATRTCNNPKAEHGGLTCAEQDLGPDYREQSCNTDPCVVVTDGGYSAWSEWSECSSSCGTVPGFFPGTQRRQRKCNNPSPSPDGQDCSLLGPAKEERPCNLERCSAPLKKCPGIVLITNNATLTTSRVPCSAHGECTRTRPLAECTEEDDTCIVTCICDSGWLGEVCDVDEAEMKRRQKLRTQFIASMVSMSSQVDTSAKGLSQQASSLAKISSKPSEMGETAQNLTFNFIGSMTGNAGNSDDGLDSDTANSMAGTVSNLVLATGLNKVEAAIKAGGKKKGRRRLQETEDIKKNAQASVGKIRDTLTGIGNAVMSSKLPGEEQTTLDTPQLKLTVQKQPSQGGSELSLGGGVSFSFPDNFGEKSGAAQDGLNMQAIQWTTNPYGWSNSSEGLVSGVTSMTVADSNGQVDVNGLPQPILFLIPITKIGDLETATCSYWDAVNEEFTSKGMLIAGYRVVNGKLFLECETLHLTDFSAFKSNTKPDINLVDPIGDAALLLTVDLSNALPIWVLIALAVIFSILFVLGFLADRKKSKILEVYRKEKFLQTGKVTGMAGEVFTKRKMRMSVWARFVEGIKSEHDWGSIVSPEIPDHAVLSRTQRLAVLFSNCMCAIAVCAMFYGTQQGNVGSVLVVSVISAAMMLPSSVVFPKAFKYINRMNSPATLTSRTRVTLKQRLKARLARVRNKGPKKYRIQDVPNEASAPLSPSRVTSTNVELLKPAESSNIVMGGDAEVREFRKAFSRKGSNMMLLDHEDNELDDEEDAKPTLTIDTLAPLANDKYHGVSGSSSVRSLPPPSPTTPHTKVPTRAPQTPAGNSSAQPNPELIKSVSMVLRKPVVKLKRLKKISNYERYAIEERRRGRRPIPQHLHNMICRIQARVRGKLARLRYEQALLDALRKKRYEHPAHVIPVGKHDEDVTNIKRWIPPIKGKLAWTEKAKPGGKGSNVYYTYGEHKPVLKIQKVVRGYLSRVRVKKLKDLLERIEKVKDRAASQRAMRIKCASRIQAAYRGRAGRRRAERALEYDRWKQQNRGRRVLTAIVYFVVTVTILFTFYINLIYGVKFDNNQAYGWIIASMTSIALDAFLQKPLQLLFKAFAGPYFALALANMVPF